MRFLAELEWIQGRMYDWTWASRQEVKTEGGKVINNPQEKWWDPWLKDCRQWMADRLQAVDGWKTVGSSCFDSPTLTSEKRYLSSRDRNSTTASSLSLDIPCERLFCACQYCQTRSGIFRAEESQQLQTIHALSCLELPTVMLCKYRELWFVSRPSEGIHVSKSIW